jgi:two-component system OmpR family sensor kinase
MLTLTQKIIVAYSLVFGLALCGFALLVHHNTRITEIGKLDSQINDHINAIQDEIEEWKNDNKSGINLDSTSYPVDLRNAKIRIFDQTGNFVAGDTTLDGLPAREIAQVLKGKFFYDMTTFKNRRYRSVWAPLDRDDRILFAVQVLAPMDNIAYLLRKQLLLFMCIIPAILIFTGMAAYLITKKSLRTILSIVEKSHTISAGSLDRRLPVPRPNDEIKALAISLNLMIERIGLAFDAQRRFVADAAHAMRTPLTIINGELDYAENLISGELKKSISAAHEEGERLARLAEQLLALARLDAIAGEGSDKLTTVRLDEIMINCVQRLSSVATKKKIDLQIRISEAIELQGDADRLSEMIRNLIDNAIKYSPSGSSVLALLVLKDTGVAVITVCDNGPGIDNKDLPHIFERFYRSETVRAQATGSGLGLAIVEQVVRLHRGVVRVESSPGKGTTFIIELPLEQTQNLITSHGK